MRLTTQNREDIEQYILRAISAGDYDEEIIGEPAVTDKERLRDGKVQGKYCAVWNGEVHKDSRGLYQANVREMRQ